MASDQERFLAKRVQSLEWELDREKRKNMDAHKAICKRDRLVKELTLKTEQDKQILKDLQVVIEDLESSLKIHRNKMENVVSFIELFKSFNIKTILLLIFAVKFVNFQETISNYNADRFRKVHRMYLDESGRSEKVKEELRRIRATGGKTSLFVQI